MNLHSLEHVGSYAFPDKPIRIDFDALPELIAIHGRNESGKSTILDLITAATRLTMPYRPGALVNNFIKRYEDGGWARPGHITLDWSTATGERFISKVLVDPALNKTEATLHPYAGGPIEAGPLQRDYLKAITKHLGSLELFLCTAYAVQDSRSNAKPPWSFLRAEKLERRQVMTEILTLGRFTMLEASAKDKAVALEKQLQASRFQIQVLEPEAARVKGLEEELRLVNFMLDKLKSDLTEAEEAVKVAHTAIKQARAKVAGKDALQARQGALRAEIASLNQRADEIALRIANNRKLLAGKGAILKAAARMEEIQGLIRVLDGEIDEAQAVTDRAREARREVEAARAKLEFDHQARTNGYLNSEAAFHRSMTTHRDLLQSVSEEIEREIVVAEKGVKAAVVARDFLVRQTEIMESVPCGGVGEYAKCQFLVDAVKAKESLGEATANIDAAQSVFAKTKHKISPDDPRVIEAGKKLVAARAAFDAVGQAPTLDLPPLPPAHVDSVQALKEAKAALLKESVGLKANADYKPALDVATDRLVDLEKQADTMEKDIEAKNTDLRVVGLELTMLEAHEREVQQAESKLSVAKQWITALLDQSYAQERERGRVDGLLEKARGAVEQIKKLQADVAPTVADLEDWALIAKACSPRGIPTLRIDAAFPAIGELATTLLQECYGEALYEIRFVTQRQSLTDEKKLLEDIDVLVRKGNELIKAELLSGGASVLVSEAVALGISLYQAIRTGRMYGTLMRDEVGAPLDSQRGPAFIKMLRKATKIGGFSRTLFVSHDPACIELADARVHVENGELTFS